MESSWFKINRQIKGKLKGKIANSSAVKACMQSFKIILPRLIFKKTSLAP